MYNKNNDMLFQSLSTAFKHNTSHNASVVHNLALPPDTLTLA